MDEWVAVAQAARLLSVTPQRVRQLMEAGRLEYRMGVYGREVNGASLERLIQERSEHDTDRRS